MHTKLFDWKGIYNEFHNKFPGYRKQPVIGITGNFGDKGCELAEGYFDSVIKAGGTPVIIPPYTDKNALINTLENIDALILSGGGDINPLFVNEEPINELHGINHKRDLAELLTVRLAYDRQIPMLGICRGMQIITAALDGSIWQDIYKQSGQNPIKHSQQLDRAYASHSVFIDDNSILKTIFGENTVFVNSFHHQAVKDAGPHLKVSAKASDGIIEAVESNEHKSIIGVQWHPECFTLVNDSSMMPLFEWLVREAANFSEAKDLHRNIITLDSHCDTPMFFGHNIKFDRRDNRILVDLHKMNEGKLDAVIMAAYLQQKERDDISLKAANAKARQIINQIEEMVAMNCHAAAIAYNADDIIRIKKEGKKAIMLGIENGYAIGKDLSELKYFRDRGVVYITLCHNGDNDICDSAKGCAEHGGLSSFGKEVVKEMNRLGIMIDLSHAAESTFYDTLETSKVPVVCSHSSSKALCNVPRNLSDEQLKALADKGGVAQVTLYNGFLRTDGCACITDAIEHLNHMVNIMGVEHVGIGTDFDGDGGIPGCASASEVINFTRRLLAERYSHEDIARIWGENFLRVMKTVQNSKEL